MPRAVHHLAFVHHVCIHHLAFATALAGQSSAIGTTLDGGGVHQILRVAVGASLHLQTLRLENGRAVGPVGPSSADGKHGDEEEAEEAEVGATVTLAVDASGGSSGDADMADGTADGAAAGAGAAGPAGQMPLRDAKAYLGGAICSQGTLVLTNVALRGNVAEWGGALYVEGNLEAHHVALEHNHALRCGGGLYFANTLGKAAFVGSLLRFNHDHCQRRTAAIQRNDFVPRYALGGPSAAAAALPAPGGVRAGGAALAHGGMPSPMAEDVSGVIAEGPPLSSEALLNAEWAGEEPADAHGSTHAAAIRSRGHVSERVPSPFHHSGADLLARDDEGKRAWHGRRGQAHVTPSPPPRQCDPRRRGHGGEGGWTYELRCDRVSTLYRRRHSPAPELAARLAARASAEDVAGVSSRCVRWHTTSNCDPEGPIESGSEMGCLEFVPPARSGFCACAAGQRAGASGCGHAIFTCEEQCARLNATRASAVAGTSIGDATDDTYGSGGGGDRRRGGGDGGGNIEHEGGGGGGGHATVGNGEGDAVVVGLFGRFGDVLDGLGVLCSDGTRTPLAPSVGGGHKRFEWACPGWEHVSCRDVDDEEQCGLWAGAGECERNPEYMHHACAASCATCAPPPPPSVLPPRATAAVGLRVRAGDLVDAVQLRCGGRTGDVSATAHGATAHEATAHGEAAGRATAGSATVDGATFDGGGDADSKAGRADGGDGSTASGGASDGGESASPWFGGQGGSECPLECEAPARVLGGIIVYAGAHVDRLSLAGCVDGTAPVHWHPG